MFNSMFKDIEGMPMMEEGGVELDKTFPFRISKENESEVDSPEGYTETEHFYLERFQKMSVSQLEKFLESLKKEHDEVEENAELTEDERRREFKRLTNIKVLIFEELADRKKITVNLDKLFEDLTKEYDLSPEDEWEKENILHDPTLTNEDRIVSMQKFVERFKANDLSRFVGELPTMPDIKTDSLPKSRAA